MSARVGRPGLITAAALLVWSGLVGCPEEGRWFGTVRLPHGTDELWLNNGAEAESLDPGRISGAVGGELAYNLFAGLARWHPQTLVPEPELATGYEVSDGGRRYRFRLRPSTWSDGAPLGAADFEWSWRRVLDPATGSRYASLLYLIENGAAFNQRALMVTGTSSAALGAIEAVARRAATVERVEWSPRPPAVVIFAGGEGEARRTGREAVRAALDGRPLGDARLSVRTASASDVGVRAVGPLELEVRLTAPYPFFVSLLPFYVLRPVPRHLLERLAGTGVDPELWTRPEHIVSNGAYLLKQWRFRQELRFEANPRYWDAASVRTPKVRVAMVESYNTALNLYRAAEMDWIGTNTSLPAEFMDHLTRYEDFGRAPKLSVYWFWLNTTRPPLDDVRVRRALSLAVDRRSLVEHVMRAGQVPTADVVPDGLAGYQGLGRPIFDPERARALLVEAGFPGGAGFPKLSLSYNTSEAHKQIAEAIQAMWQRELGVDIELQNQEWKVYVDQLEGLGFDIARLGWSGDYADPYTFLEVFTRHNGNNHSGWSDPEYESLLARANQESEPGVRMGLLREAEARLADASPVIATHVYTRSYLKKPYLRGFWRNYLDWHPWRTMWIDPRGAERAAEDPPPTPRPFVVERR